MIWCKFAFLLTKWYKILDFYCKNVTACQGNTVSPQFLWCFHSSRITIQFRIRAFILYAGKGLQRTTKEGYRHWPLPALSERVTGVLPLTIRTFMRFFSIRDFWSSLRVDANNENKTKITRQKQGSLLFS